jgi:DNA-binding transcriptional LysR family regulator
LRNARLEISAYHWKGLLRIATTMLPSVYLLPSILKKFKAVYRNIEVEILTGSTEMLVPKIRDNSAELGLLDLPPCSVPIISEFQGN